MRAQLLLSTLSELLLMAHHTSLTKLNVVRSVYACGAANVQEYCIVRL